MRVLITGAAKRIGRMLAKELAQRGHKIAIHYNSSDIEAMKLLSELGGAEAGHIVIKCDLNNLDEASRLIPELRSWGKPAILINNASTYFRRGMENYSNEDLLSDYTVNFFSPLILMREFKKQCGFGTIINFLDRRVDLVEPEAGPYAFAKKSLRDATEACAQGWATKVRVNAIAPGPVLLPEEDYNSASEAELLDKICQTVIRFTETDVNGEICIID